GPGVEDGDAIGTAVGGVERAAAGAEGDADGPASAGKRDGPRDRVGLGVEDRHGVAAGVGDVYGPLVRGHRHLCRGDADAHRRDHLVGGSVDDRGGGVELGGDVDV